MIKERFLSAVKKNDLAGLHSLLSRVSSNIVSTDGKSALFYALSNQHVSMTKLLLEHGADVNVSSHVTYFRDNQLVAYYEPPVVTATRLGNTSLLELLLSAGANSNNQAKYISLHGNAYSLDSSALHYACEQSNIAMVQLLLKYDAVVNVNNRHSEQPLHIVARCKQCSLQTQIMQLMCSHGAAVNSLNKTGRPPLYMAAFYECEAKVSLLISHGANVNFFCLSDNNYGTALHIAAIKDNYAIAYLLVKSGAKLDIQNNLGYTPLQLNINSRSKSSIAEMLIFHGAGSSIIDHFRYTILASCLRTTRLDCETLVPLLVFSGYNLWLDEWLSINTCVRSSKYETIPPEVDLEKGRIKRLCDWLREMRQNPHSLKNITRIVIRHWIIKCTDHHSIVAALKCLPLPRQLIEFLLLKNLLLNVNLINDIQN